MTGGARPPAPPLELRLLEDVASAFYLHLEVADRPGVLAAVTQVLGEQGVSIKIGRPARTRRERAAGDGHPQVAESRLRAAIALLEEFDFVRSTPRTITGNRRGVRMSASYTPVPLPRVEGAAFSGTHVPLIERYHERLPFAARRQAGQSAGGLDAAAARAGALGAGRRDRAPEARGRQPDRLVQGSRHDLRGLGRGARRRQGRDLRLHRQHRRERRRLRRPRRHHLRGDRPRGEDRAGQDGPDARSTARA